MRPAERERYRLRARLGVHRRRVAAAHAIVRRATEAHPGVWAVGASGGKDSAALVSVAVEAGWRGPLFHFWYAETPAENTALVYALGERYGLPVDTVRVPGAFDLYDRVGFFTDAATPEQRAAVAAMEREYKATAEAFAAARYTGIFWGLRAAESRARAITVARMGTLYRAQGRRTWTALPLARWEADDVWARTVADDLPWLARYDAAEDRGRERSEETWLACGFAWATGQGQDLRRRDPALWQRLTARWPELRREG